MSIRKINLALITVLTGTMIACIESPEGDVSQTKFNQLKVNENFDWKTTQTFDLNVSVLESKSYTLKSKITVYNADPNLDGEIVASGSAAAGKPFSTKLSMPAAVKQLFIKYESPYGISDLIATPIVGSRVDYTFGASAKSADMRSKSATVAIPTCESCVNVISGDKDVTIAKGATYCVTSSFTGKIDMQAWNGGGTLQVCGSAVIGSLSLGDNCNIIVLNGGKLEVGTLEVYGKNSMVKTYGTGILALKNTFSTFGYLVNDGTITGSDLNLQNLNSTFVNNGTINLTGQLQLNGTVSAENYGSITTGKSLQISTSGYLHNYGLIEVKSGMFQVNNKAEFNNSGSVSVDGSIEFNSSKMCIDYCKMTATKNITINGGDVAVKQGYMVSGNDFTVNNSRKLILTDIAMVRANNVTLNSNASIVGESSTNVVLASNVFTINGKETVNGLVEVSTPKFVFYTNNISNHLLNGAYTTTPDQPKAFIPKSACNEGGFGKLEISDTDLDGVEDDMDEFPADPNLAYTSYFPAKGSNGSLAFEDLWPSQGDYDFNDLVVDFSGEMLVNADNMVQEMTVVFEIKAIGASMDNGFAFSFNNVMADQIKYVEGAVLSKELFKLNDNGTEAEQKEAVFVVFDSPSKLIHRMPGAYFNTENDKERGTSDAVKLHIVFAEPVSTELINADNFNPFMVVNQNRKKEIHLPDFAPTMLADAATLGTDDDASAADKGKYYRSKAGLPWAILIFEPFDYPVERAIITDAHLHMAEWAVSGGKVYTDWYKDLKGYRNYDKIFKK